MKESEADLELRPATFNDAEMVADLETAREPDNPRDPAMLAFFWGRMTAGERWMRLVSERDGVARAYVAAGHGKWSEGQRRFSWIRVTVHPDDWDDDRYTRGVATAEDWLRSEAAETTVAHIPEDFEPELRVLAGLGYREERRDRVWHLDLVAGRERLLTTVSKTREEMKRQGIRLMTLDQDGDPERMQKLFKLDLEATEDVPKTAPWPVPTFEEWQRIWFENPGMREDRFWIAREGDEIVGLSVVGYPPHRGDPWTSFTGTSRKVRGRGIARALKYETIAQAIAIGAKRVETHNDSENAPILHLNEEIGYEAAKLVIELHRDLA